jgi:hypothetical protein
MTRFQDAFNAEGIGNPRPVENHLDVLGDALDARWTRIIPDGFLTGTWLDALALYHA